MTLTLVLNASYEPLVTVAQHRAVTLVLAEKATVVEPGDGVFRSERVELPAPDVVRLMRYVHVPYAAVVPLTRRALFHRDDYACGYCGGRPDTIDHVVPKSRGGRHEWTNVVAACQRCNHRKADRLLADIGWSLAVMPEAPRGRHFVFEGRETSNWSKYLGKHATAEWTQAAG